MPTQIMQEQRTEIFVLFPEYVDANHITSAPYIGNYSFDWKDSLPNEVIEIMNIISSFSYEYASFYYDGHNVKSMLFPFETLEEYPTPIDAWNSFAYANSLFDWRDDKNIVGEDAFYCSIGLLEDTLTTVYARNKLKNKKLHATILGIKVALPYQNNGCLILQNSKRQNIKVSICSSYICLYNWLCSNRLPQRRCDYNSKHGENRKYRRKGKNGSIICPLCCSLTRAQTLLEKAIGNSDRNGMLWYYDEAEKKCIIFENQCESPQPAFHGYHVTPIDDNFSNIDIEKLRKVCSTIPTKFNKRFK